MASEFKKSYMPDEKAFLRGLAARNRRGRIGQIFYYIAISIAILALVTLFANVINEAFGTIATTNEIEPETLTEEGTPLEQLSSEELAAILAREAAGRVPVLLRDTVASLSDPGLLLDTPIGDMIASYPAEYGDTTLRQIRQDLPAEEASLFIANLLAANVSQPAMVQFVEAEVVQLQIVESWPLFDTIFNYDLIQAEAAEKHPDAELVRFYSWLSADFISTPMSSVPAQAGIRTALFGSLYMMALVILVSLPIGVGAAIYLQEYATDNWVNRIIETNVRNLAGVPSIIYGMLGLAVLVRLFAPITAGQVFGFNMPETSEARVYSIVAGVVGYEDMPPLVFPILAEGLQTNELNRLLNGFSQDQLEQFTAPLNEAQFAALEDRVPDLDLPAPDAANTVENEAQLTADEAQRLVDVFFGFRQPRLIDTGQPSRETFENAVRAAVDLDRLNEAEFDALVTQLEQYARVTINGRTILSAALTLALLILPIIIINAQEALRAVPYTLREASYGLGATKWQTIWRSILPSALPGIMTGTILAVSRAVGETAPLIVVGASTFILTDPSSPFSKFTALPIQIYQWTARPQDQFRDIAAAAIIVLLVVMLTLNAIAIILRNRYSIRY